MFDNLDRTDLEWQQLSERSKPPVEFRLMNWNFDGRMLPVKTRRRQHQSAPLAVTQMTRKQLAAARRAAGIKIDGGRPRS